MRFSTMSGFPPLILRAVQLIICTPHNPPMSLMCSRNLLLPAPLALRQPPQSYLCQNLPPRHFLDNTIVTTSFYPSSHLRRRVPRGQCICIYHIILEKSGWRTAVYDLALNIYCFSRGIYTIGCISVKRLKAWILVIYQFIIVLISLIR